MKQIQNKGFTLIELLVVVAIIAILALIALLAINPVELARRSRDSRRLSDLGTLRRAIDLALADGKTLPTGTTNRTTGGSGVTLDPSDAAANLMKMDVSKYMSTIPQDPQFTNTAATQVTTGATCTTTPGTTTIAAGSMVYTFKSDGTVYQLEAYLESNDNCTTVNSDGHVDGKYEIGTAPNLSL